MASAVSTPSSASPESLPPPVQEAQPTAAAAPVAPVQQGALSVPSDADALTLYRTLQSGSLQPGDPRAVQAAALLRRYRDAKQAIGETPFQPSAAARQKTEEQFDSLYAGLDKVPEALAPDKRQQLSEMLGGAPDKNEATAAAVNTAYISELHPEIDAATLQQNWPAIRQAFAKEALGIDNPNITDTQLYGDIGRHIQAKRAEASMVREKILGPMQQAALSGQADWLSAYSPIAQTLNKEQGYLPEDADHYRRAAQAAFNDIRHEAAPLMPLAHFIVSTLAGEAGKQVSGAQSEGFDALPAKSIGQQIQALPAQARPLLFSIVQHLAQADPALAQSQQDTGFWANTRNALMRSLGSTVEGISDLRGNALVVQGQRMLQNIDKVRIVGAPGEGESLLQHLAASPIAMGPTLLGRPLNAGERAQLKNEVGDLQSNLEISRTLRDITHADIDPIKGNALTKYWYGAVQMGGQMAPAAIPVAGLPLLLGAMTGHSTDAYLRQGYSPEQAQRLGLFDGAIQGATMFAMGKVMEGPASDAIAKALPGLRTMIEGTPLSQAAARGLVTTGTLNVGTALQELSHPVVAQIASNLSQEYPHVDWNAEFKGYAGRRLDTFFTMLPLTLLGTGAAMLNPETGPRYLQTKAILDQAFTEPVTKQILEAPSFDAKQAIVRDNWFSKSARVSAAAMEDMFAQNQTPEAMTGLRRSLSEQAKVARKANQAAIMELAGMDPEGDALVPRVTQNPDGSFNVHGPDGTGGDRAVLAESALDLVEALRQAHPDSATGTVTTLPASISPDLPKRSPYALGFTSGQGLPDALADAWSKLSNSRIQFKNWLSRMPTNDKLSYTMDQTHNAADIYARQNAGGMVMQLQRDLGLEKLPEANATPRLAVTAMVEAGADLQTLRQHQALLDAVKPGGDAHMPSVVKLSRAVRFAIDHFQELVPIARRYMATTDGQVAQENANGIATPRRENYVPHMQDVDDGLNLAFESKGGGTGTGFKKGRTFDTYIDSALAGIKPKTLDPFVALENRLSRGQRAINRRLWIEAGRSLIDALTNLPVVTSPQVVDVPGPDVLNPTRQTPITDQRTQQVAPKGYELRNFGGQQIAVHRAYASLFDAFMDPSDLAKSPVVAMGTKYAQEMKHFTLGLDIYHLSRMAYYQLGFGANPFTGFKLGRSLLDYSDADLNSMVQSGQLSKSVADRLMPDLAKRRAQLSQLVDAGLNVGSVGENLHNHLVHAIPGMRSLNRFIFDSYTRGGMTWAALLEMDRRLAADPTAAPETVARKVASDVNIRFANLGNQSWIKSRTFRGLLQMAFLSPAWNEGLIRSELGAMRQAVQLGMDAAAGRKVVAGGLLKNIGTLMAGQFAMNQLINYATRGQPTWKNKEEGTGAKISAWVPDPFGHSAGYFLNPFSLPAEITGQIIQGMERTGSISATAQRMSEGKMFFAGKAADVFLTHKDFMTPIMDDKAMAWALTKALVPVVPIQAAPLVAGAKSVAAGHVVEDFPGEIGKQILSTAGLKAESAPTPEGRMYGLASEFRRAHDIGHVFGDREPSDYQPLLTALKGGDDEEATKIMEDLLTRKSPYQMAHYFATMPGRPFVAGKDGKSGQPWEAQFEASLDPEQKQAFAQARSDRAALGQKAIDLLDTLVKSKGTQ